MTAPIVKLSQLAAASALTGAETVPVVQSGVTKRTTSAALIPIPVPKLTFDTTVANPPAFGEMAWNSEDMTVDVGLSGGVVLQLGQETLMKVKADETLAAGQLIMATGADGNSGRIRAAKANGTAGDEHHRLPALPEAAEAGRQIGDHLFGVASACTPQHAGAHLHNPPHPHLS
jgi:hypothetical protein